MNDTSLRVSIITVCFNSEATISDTINSVLSQDYPNIEYIIIDGVSSDSTLDIVNKLKKKDTILVSEKDDGIYDAINKGINLATGEIIGVLNSDDFYIDNSVISDVVKTMEQSNAQSLYADLFYVDADDTNIVTRNWVSGTINVKSFLYGWMPPHPTFFVTREVYQKYGTFNLSLKSAADYELMLRFLYKKEISTSYLNRPIVRMRVGGLSNASFKNRIAANQEDREAWVINSIKPYFFTLYLKPIRKIFQFIKKAK